ncbi:MAG TPA: hypothetical protein VFE47_29005 [Tepidisphaeraceae bacterium]|jgi:hypothetical protein|nr:hypothetical protein [Tepidisphaeraceae bacterium]
MKFSITSAITTLSLLLLISATAQTAPPKLVPLPTSHTNRQIEGWTVRIDDRLLSGEGAAIGERAIKLLTARLVEIELVVPEKPLAKLRAVTIQMDLTHGGLRSMQYHPDAGWLKANGYSEQLAKCVHIPDVHEFISPFEVHRQPNCVLHELAHAYHDQVLGFDDPRIIAAYKKYVESGHGKGVLTINGRKQDHYALTNEKEFFAEMTECYWGTNDFYPFVAGELEKSEPEIYSLLRDIWGPLPGR